MLLGCGSRVREFLDLSGGTKYGYMPHAVFTIIDANHPTQEWISMTPDSKLVRAHLELMRAK